MEALGINLIQILAYIIIFFVLYFFSRKFVHKVLETTEERRKVIEQGLKYAQETEVLKTKAMTEAEKEKTKIIHDAYKHAEDIIEAAKKRDATMDQAARLRAEQLFDSAKEELEEMKVKSRNEGLREAQEIITLVVKKAFDGLAIDKEIEEKLIQVSLKGIK